MPRFHKRRLGSRRYLDFNSNALNLAMEVVQKGMSKRDAAREYNIPRTTLTRRLISGTSTGTSKPGRPPVLTPLEEEMIIERIQVMCDWGFPLSGCDLRYLVKSYLDRKGVREPRFQNNLPSTEFVYHFKKRHPILNERFAGNIKRSRAAVTKEVINDYFDHLEKELGGILPDCIYNYDETNLSDDPGRKKCLMKRGTKYPERVMNNSKACTSIMFCGSASGELLPVYVVYKAQHVYRNWISGGPPHARYACTKSGWFDGDTFEDWFRNVFIPVAKRKESTALIGDNLSSHFSPDVLRLCKLHNVKFICLPSNSTDKTQPLDVAFFHPVKVMWRKILNEWKTAHPKEATVPKSTFPSLLRQLIESIKTENLLSGFYKTGIHPLDRTKVLSRLPTENSTTTGTGTDEVAQQLDESLVDMLKTVSGRDAIRRKRGARVQFKPGKAISVEAEESNDESDKENEPDISIGTRVSLRADSDTADSTSDESSETGSESDSLDLVAPRQGSLKVSDWVTVKYSTSASSRSRMTRECHFVGQIIDVISSTEFHSCDRNILRNAVNIHGPDRKILTFVPSMILLGFSQTLQLIVVVLFLSNCAFKDHALILTMVRIRIVTAYVDMPMTL